MIRCNSCHVTSRVRRYNRPAPRGLISDRRLPHSDQTALSALARAPSLSSNVLMVVLHVPAASPVISVIIPVFKDWDRLALCLKGLDGQSIGAEDFEIIVVDNEAQHSRRLDCVPANARVIHEPRPGSYAARNTAVTISRGEFLAFIDSDCIPGPDWLANGLRILKGNRGARLTGPVPIHREEGSGYFAYLYDFHTAFKFDQAVKRGRSGAGNLMVSRAIFDRVGPFDQNLMSGGDTDWGERAHRLGVPILYDESIPVSHPARASVSAIIKKHRRIAGSEARRVTFPTIWYVLSRLLPPVTSYSRVVYSARRGPVSRRDWIVLFFIYWATQIAAAQEFLFVRAGWKRPNRS